MSEKKTGRPKKNEPLRKLAFNTRVTEIERGMMTAVYNDLKKTEKVKSETDAMIHLYEKHFKKNKLQFPSE